MNLFEVLIVEAVLRGPGGEIPPDSLHAFLALTQPVLLPPDPARVGVLIGASQYGRDKLSESGLSRLGVCKLSQDCFLVCRGPDYIIWGVAHLMISDCDVRSRRCAREVFFCDVPYRVL